MIVSTLIYSKPQMDGWMDGRTAEIHFQFPAVDLVREGRSSLIFNGSGPIGPNSPRVSAK